MLDLGGQSISDAQWVEMVEQTAEAKHQAGEKEPAVFGGVRLVDGELPRVLTWNKDRSLIVEATPEFGAGGKIRGWRKERVEALSDEPVGSGGEEAVLSQGTPQAALEAQTEADLIPMSNKALQVFEELSKDAEGISELSGCFVKDLGGDLMVHKSYPDKVTAAFEGLELGALLWHARNVQHEAEGAECMVHVMPWRYGEDESTRVIAVFGYDTRSESGFLSMLAVHEKEGAIELGELDPVSGEVLSQLLAEYEES